MSDPAAERMLNLALFIAGSAAPVSAEECRATVGGYPGAQDDAAFIRMFERDKAELRASGLVLGIDRSGSAERYFLDREATFLDRMTFAPAELVLLRAAGAVMQQDPSFPYRRDLALALAKLLSDEPGLPEVSMEAHVADEDPTVQAAAVERLTGAAAARKLSAFTYTNLRGERARREVEPYGLFLMRGRWYLVGRDRARDGIRVFTVARIEDLEVGSGRPRSPDFERPDDFDLASWMRVPFQFGPLRTDAVLRLSGPAAARAGALTEGQGTLEPDGEGGLLWTVPAADERVLAQWVVENGPGIAIVEPAHARALLRAGVKRAEEIHGG